MSVMLCCLVYACLLAVGLCHSSVYIEMYISSSLLRLGTLFIGCQRCMLAAMHCNVFQTTAKLHCALTVLETCPGYAPHDEEHSHDLLS